MALSLGRAVSGWHAGLNDWSRVNGHWLWIVVVLVSGVLFLGCAKVGSRGDRPAPAAHPPLVGAGRPWWDH
jgi:hypothetical protein